MSTQQVSKEADARMARDAWSMAVDRQRAAEARCNANMTMENCRAVAQAQRAQEAAWRRMNRMERAASDAMEAA